MESEHLNPLPDDPHFEHLLRTCLAAPPLDDAGFTGRVLGALPAPAARAARRRWMLIAAGAAVGVMIGSRGDGAVFTQLWRSAESFSAQLWVESDPFESGFYVKLLGAAAAAWWIFRDELRTLIDI